MDKINFRYSNSAIANLLWLLFGIVGGLLLISTAAIQSYLSIWFVEKFNIVGLILVIIFAVGESVLLILGSYYLSLTIEEKRGTAVFWDDYVKITKGRREIVINYMEITDIKYSEILVRVKGLRRSGYKLEIKTKSINLKIRSSLKELWKNRINELKKDFSVIKLLKFAELNEYHTTLEDIYDKIRHIKKSSRQRGISPLSLSQNRI